MRVTAKWRRVSLIGLFSWAVAVHAWAADSSVSPAIHAPLISRELMFGPAQHSMPRLSPDGAWLSFLAPTSGGITNIWLTKGLNVTSAKPLTRDTHRAILGYLWAYDSKHLLYWQDNDGDENWHLLAVNLHSGVTRDLTPYPGVRMQNLLMSPGRPDEVLVTLNRRSRMVFDVYRVNLDDGSSKLDTLNPGDVMSWTADADFVIRAATAFVPESGATVVRIRDKSGSSWRDLASWRFEEAVFTGQVAPSSSRKNAPSAGPERRQQ